MESYKEEFEGPDKKAERIETIIHTTLIQSFINFISLTDSKNTSTILIYMYFMLNCLTK